MNNRRRHELRLLWSRLYDLHGEVESVRKEEWQAANNTPRNLRFSAQGRECIECADMLNEAVNSLREAMGFLAGGAER